MERSEIKRRARQQIKGNIGVLFLVSLIIGIVTGALSIPSAIGYVSQNNVYITISPFVSIASAILAGPFALSSAYIYKGLSQGRKAKVEDAFVGFKDFGRAVVAGILQSLFIFFWSLLFIIPGLIKTYSYSMTYYILLDNHQLSANEAITQSRRMMKGNKFRLFVQHLSFLGWILLSMLTFGILFIWLAPYMEAANYNFYLDISGNNNIDQAQSNPEIQADPFNLN